MNLPQFPPFAGSKPMLLPSIKTLRYEVREMIFIKNLDFYGWEDKMPNLIIAL